MQAGRENRLSGRLTAVSVESIAECVRIMNFFIIFALYSDRDVLRKHFISRKKDKE